MSPAPTRKEAAAKPRGPGPLMTRVPLTQDRERKPVLPPRKKRKPVPPSKPALTFDAKHRHVPCGLQDPPVSPSTPVYSRPSPPEPFTGSYDEQQMDPYTDRDIPFHDGHDAQKHPRTFSEHASIEPPSASHPNTPCTEVNDMSSAPEMYDSPVSYTSSSSPASSDQSPAEFAPHATEYTRQVQLPLVMYSYDNPFVHQPAPVVQHYGHSVDPTPDRHTQNFPLQHFDTPFNRAAPHGGPGYPENNGYHHYATHRY